MITNSQINNSESVTVNAASDKLRSGQVFHQLTKIIDPDLQVDLVTGNMIRKVEIDDLGKSVSITFRPTSPTCPIALHLAQAIHVEVSELTWAESIKVYIEDHYEAEMIEKIING